MREFVVVTFATCRRDSQSTLDHPVFRADHAEVTWRSGIVLNAEAVHLIAQPREFVPRRHPRLAPFLVLALLFERRPAVHAVPGARSWMPRHANVRPAALLAPAFLDETLTHDAGRVQWGSRWPWPPQRVQLTSSVLP